MLFSALCSDTRPTVVHSLLSDEGSTWRQEVSAAINMPDYSTTVAGQKFPLLLFDTKCTDEEHQTRHRLDFLSHTALSSLIESNALMTAQQDQISRTIMVILIEALLLHFRLAKADMTRRMAESFMEAESIPFEPIEQPKAKRRKSSESKTPTKSPKMLFVGWKLPSFMSSVSNDKPQVDGESKKRSRESLEPEESSIVYNVMDLPGLITSKVIKAMLAKVNM